MANGKLTREEVTRLRNRISGLETTSRDQLRGLVDDWIQTGTQRKHADCPFERHLTAKIRSITDRLRQSGSVLVETTSGYKSIPCERGDLRLDDDQGLRWAEGLLIELLCTAEDKFRIARCGRCQSYFLLDQWNRTYRGGTVCKQCMPKRKSRRADDHKKRSRQSNDQAMYGEVAKHFCSEIRGDRDWAEKATLKEAIICHLNGFLSQRPELRKTPVSPKWLGWNKNRAGIERLVKEDMGHESL